MRLLGGTYGWVCLGLGPQAGHFSYLTDFTYVTHVYIKGKKVKEIKGFQLFFSENQIIDAQKIGKACSSHLVWLNLKEIFVNWTHQVLQIQHWWTEFSVEDAFTPTQQLETNIWGITGKTRFLCTNAVYFLSLENKSSTRMSPHCAQQWLLFDWCLPPFSPSK